MWCRESNRKKFPVEARVWKTGPPYSAGARVHWKSRSGGQFVRPPNLTYAWPWPLILLQIILQNEKIFKCTNLGERGCLMHQFFLKILFIFREREGREKERERNIDVREKQCLVASHIHLNLGLNPQRRRVPWLGIRLVTLCFAGRHPTHWATPGRVTHQLFNTTRKSRRWPQCL